MCEGGEVTEAQHNYIGKNAMDIVVIDAQKIVEQWLRALEGEAENVKFANINQWISKGNMLHICPYIVAQQPWIIYSTSSKNKSESQKKYSTKKLKEHVLKSLKDLQVTSWQTWDGMEEVARHLQHRLQFQGFPWICSRANFLCSIGLTILISEANGSEIRLHIEGVPEGGICGFTPLW